MAATPAFSGSMRQNGLGRLCPDFFGPVKVRETLGKVYRSMGIRKYAHLREDRRTERAKGLNNNVPSPMILVCLH
jgi:hypothetical protein